MCRLWHFPETLSLTHVKRRLLNTVLNRTHRRRTADRHMGVSECQWHSSCEPTEPTGEKAASGLSEAVPQGYIHQSSHKRQAEHLPCRHRQAGTGTLPQAHRGHETGAGHNGTPKGRKRLRMDRAAQQHKGLCKGDCERGNYFCIATHGR